VVLKKLVRKQSLFVTLGIIIVSIIAVITLTSTSYIYILLKDRLIEDMKHDSDLSIASLKENVTNLVAAYSENEYINLISNEMEQRRYFSIIVEDNNMGKILGKQPYLNGKVRDNNGNMIDFDANNSEHLKWLDMCFYSQKKALVTSSGNELGAISIYISDHYMKKELNEMIVFTLINAFVISLFLVLTLFISIRKFILKPISNITNVINHSDEDGVPIELVTENGSIEISTLSNTINGMIRSIKISRNDFNKQHEQLKAREKQLSLQGAAMKAASDGIVITDIKGNVNWVNPAFEKLTGYQFDEVLEQNIKILNSGLQSDSFYQNLWQTILSGNTWQGEQHNAHKDGHVYLEEETITPVLDEMGEIAHFVSVKRDITVQRQKEMQLQRTQKMDALGKLTGGVAHDFNNMLGVILGYAELLKDNLSSDAKLFKYASEIYHAGERGAKLTGKLLSFSRKKSSESEIVNINELLKEEQHMLEKTLTVSIKLVLDLYEDVWPVWVDASDLEDAILNMSINAMHAMSEGGQLTISTSNHHLALEEAQYLGLASGDYVLLMLTDTGRGMDEETQKLIFDPFFSTKGDKGTGLGLSQVYSFTRRVKGSIKVYSELGHGSRFVIYFPRYQDASNKQSENKKFDKAEDLSGNESILVVDDEHGLLDLTESILTNHGYRVLCAENAEQAMVLLETETVNLLLSDVIMPDMDGYQLAAKVSALYPAVKIQLASGFSETRHHGLVSNDLQQNMLYKPYNSQQLLQQVRAILDDSTRQENSQVTAMGAETIQTPIEWTESITTDIDEIDADHKKLLAILNRCQSGVINKKEDEFIKAILDELLDYTKDHFQREEVIMKVSGYPELEKHRDAHKVLIKQTNSLIGEYEQGLLSIQKVYIFLLDWLTDHIMEMDMDITPYAKGKEKEISQALEVHD
jgi:two-component system, cell cycle sensor histidine kinase and response regulator CckA